MKQKEKNGNLIQIRAELERRLIVLRYSQSSINNYLRIFDWIQEFLIGYGKTSYSKEDGQQFIAEYILQPQHLPSYFSSAKVVVRRMDEILEGRLFTPQFCKPKPTCPLRFQEWHHRYFEDLKRCGLCKSTISNHERYIDRLLGLLDGSVLSLDQLLPQHIYNLFTQHEQPIGSYPITKRFLVFLFEQGVTATDLSPCIPRYTRPRPYPSIYSGDEVSRLLSSVDRSTSIGKRDYAVLMLASRLGMRSSDIVGLSLDDIDHQSLTIGITQAKTQRPLILIMNTDVQAALDDYITNGRPESSSKKVFLGSQAPYAPLTPGAGHAIAHRHFERAGIAPLGRRRGTHALRMSYATALIANGVPYCVVQEALGHDDPESAKYYVRVDVKRLRSCALKVPKPTGAFALNLGDLEGRL